MIFSPKIAKPKKSGLSSSIVRDTIRSTLSPTIEITFLVGRLLIEPRDYSNGDVADLEQEGEDLFPEREDLKMKKLLVLMKEFVKQESSCWRGRDCQRPSIQVWGSCLRMSQAEGWWPGHWNTTKEKTHCFVKDSMRSGDARRHLKAKHDENHDSVYMPDHIV